MRGLGLAVALLLAAPVVAQLQGLTNQGLTVYYEARDQQFAETALHSAMAALPTLQSALGLDRDSGKGISLIVTRSEVRFNEYAGEKMPPWVQGVALSGRRIVLKTLAPAVMRTTVAHELTHVLLDELAARYDVSPPRWLHEGLAKFAADDFTQNDRDLLGKAVVEGRLLKLDQLEPAFSGTREQVSLAYAQSYALVKLLHELQPGGLPGFLQNLALTGDVHRALLRTYGQTAEAIERTWLEQVGEAYGRHGLPFPGELLIWIAMGVLFLLAVAVHRRRRRAIRERLQEEERLRRIFGVVPADEVDEPDEVDEEYWE